MDSQIEVLFDQVSYDEVVKLLTEVPMCNEEEARKVLVMREALSKVDPNDPRLFVSYSNTSLLRFLRARKGDCHRAYRALIRNQEWKRDFIPTIDPKEFQHETDSGKLVIYGYDLLNRPILRINAEKHDKNKRSDVYLLKKFLIHTMETISKLTIPGEEKITILFDLSGFSFNCMDYEVVQMFVSVLQLNYPEMLSTAYILNAPLIFSACWLVIKPWIDPVTAAKVKFISSSEYSSYFPS
jgi:hypothetical protein